MAATLVMMVPHSPAAASTSAVPQGHAPGTHRSTHLGGVVPVLASRRVFVLGDSLTCGTLMYGVSSSPYLFRAMRSAHLVASPSPSAQVGRTVGEGLGVLRRAHVAGRTVLIALGTNDSSASTRSAARWIGAARAIVGPDTTLLWVGIALGARPAAADRVNAGLRAGVTSDNRRQRSLGRSGRTYFLDWDAYARDHLIANRPDGIHYSPENYGRRAAFYAGTVRGGAAYVPYVSA